NFVPPTLPRPAPMTALTRLAVLAASLFVLAPIAGAQPDPAKPVTPKAEPAKLDPADQSLVDFVTGQGFLADKPFAKGEYTYVRAAFSKHVEAQHGPAMRAALGPD